MRPNPRLGLIACMLLSAASLGSAAETVANDGSEPKKPQSGHAHRGPKQLILENAEGARITLWKPDLTTQPLSMNHGGITIPRTGMDNYHALVVEKDWGDSRETLIRYEYLFGRPSQHSPSELAGAVKTDLEIVPAPIPREHLHYLSDQRWGFQVRFKGMPRAQVPLTLETSHGTRLEAVTDRKGYAVFRLPDDFPDIVPGERDGRSAEFTVSASAEVAGTAYETLLTASYQVNPSHWQSTPLGWFVVGLGFIAGGVIGRQKGRGGQGS